MVPKHRAKRYLSRLCLCSENKWDRKIPSFCGQMSYSWCLKVLERIINLTGWCSLCKTHGKFRFSCWLFVYLHTSPQQQEAMTHGCRFRSSSRQVYTAGGGGPLDQSAHGELSWSCLQYESPRQQSREKLGKNSMNLQDTANGFLKIVVDRPTADDKGR